MGNEEKLALGHTLAEIDNGMPNSILTDCEAYGNEWGWAVQCSTYDEIISFIDTLEVKEVDLSKYINKYFKGWYVDLTDQGNILHTPDGNAGLMSMKEVAKHFFELGLNSAQKGG